MEIEVGQEAPDFTLADEDGERVTLSALRGTPVVLVFFPAAFSGACTAELCQVRDDYSGWEAKGAKVFGVSRDTRFALAAFKKQEGFSHSLLSDYRGDVAKQYGVWNERGACADRATFVIDREGKLAYAIHNDVRTVRDHSEVEQHIG